MATGCILELRIPDGQPKITAGDGTGVRHVCTPYPDEDLMSFEIVGFSESTHFYIRLPEHLSKLVEVGHILAISGR